MPVDWIAPSLVAAFVLGTVARSVGLPPLIGFLAAGFGLRALGMTMPDELGAMADLGVTLLLFAIGLKLDVRFLLRPSIWGGATLHAIISSAVITGLVWLLTLSTWGLTNGLSLELCLLIGFALSFSSTVFAVKLQEESGEGAAVHARTAIGILVMQDIFAVVFLAAAKGQPPAPWAVALVPALFLVRPPLMMLMTRAGHGELMVLLSWLVPMVGYLGFESVGVKGDLGALVIGALVAAHPKAAEMARSLLSFKDLLLVGFFLSIGLKAEPSLNALWMALLLLLLLPFKSVLFFLILTRFRLLARTALLGALGLTCFSEFGLIIASLAFDSGWLSSEWLTVLALTVSLSFILAAPLNANAVPIYAHFHDWLRGWETEKRLPEDEPVPLGRATVVVFGMGRLGTTCYDEMEQERPGGVVGVDAARDVVERHCGEGRRVVFGDAQDQDFWERCEAASTAIVLLCLPKTAANIHAAERLREQGFEGRMAAVSHYRDEVPALQEAGVDLAFDLYREAGVGLIDTVREQVAKTGLVAAAEEGGEQAG